MTQLTQQVNILQIHSMLATFYIKEKHCDLTVKVGKQIFKTHRVLLASLSEYFDFILDKGESAPDKHELITLSEEIEAIAFKEILHFMYCGDVKLNDSNIYPLIQASHLLKIRVDFIEEQCVNYLRENVIRQSNPLPNALEILEFARATKREYLFELITVNILEFLNHFINDDYFVKMSIHSFSFLLENKWNFTDENTLSEAVVCWMDYALEERKKYCGQLMECVDFSNISGHHFIFLMRKYRSAMIHIIASNHYRDSTLSSSPNDVENSENSNVMNDRKTNKASFHIYVKYKHKPLMAVFSTRNSACQWSRSFEFDSEAKTKQSVALSDTLYCLTSEKNALTFKAGDSVCSLPSVELKSPPFTMEQFSTCGTRSGIYLYNATDTITLTGQTSGIFDYEELTRGIFHYNCEVDEWFPVPAMPKRVYHSSVVTDDKLLYLIGSGVEPRNVKLAQALDFRTNKWLYLPEITNIQNECISGDCCTHGGNIYMANVDCYNIHMHVFEPQAWKWREDSKLSNSVGDGLKLVPFKNNLWMISSRSFADVFTVALYDICTQTSYSLSSSLRNSIEKVAESSYFMDAIVF